ncbi:MAG: FAD-binding oxidoreductase [Candidatus Thorarchaeota archaeon]
MKEEMVARLRRVVGDEYVSTREDVLLTYSQSASMASDPVRPGVVVRPKDTHEVSEILKIASEFNIPVQPRGGGSSLQEEVIPEPDGLVVDLLRLDNITFHENLRSVTVGAGVTYGALDKFLNKHDRWVPVYPESSLVCTVAGQVAVNGAGPGSSLFGCSGEMVLGVEVVLPDGTVLQTGSEANPYAPGPFQRYSFGPDITGLFIGSLGSFGIITKVSMKTMRRMKHFDYCTYGFDTPEQAEKFVVEVKQHDINCLFVSIYEGGVIGLFMDMLGDELGIPQYDWPHRTVPMTIGRVRKDQLESDAKMARELCKQLGGTVIGVPELPSMEWDGRLWNFVRACYVHGWHWRTLYHHQTPTNSHRSVEEITKVMDKYGFLGHTAGFATGHASFNAYPHLYFDVQDKEEEDKIRTAHRELAETLFKTGAVPFKLAEYWKDAMSGMDDYNRFLKGLKETMDPKGIMNRRVLGGI